MAAFKAAKRTKAFYF